MFINIMNRVLLIFACLLANSAFISANEEQAFEDGIYKEAVGFVMECAKKEISLCFKERAFRYIDNLPANLDVGGGIKIKQISDVERTAKQYAPTVFPEEARARESAIENALFQKITDYVTSHTIEFKVPSDSVRDMQRSMEEGRKKQGGGGGGGKKGGMGMMMMMGMKAALLGALALKGIALIAFKALVVAKIALTISLIIALKKLLGGQSHSSTYEVVAHPVHEEHGHGHGGHWDRSFGADLAYKGYQDYTTSAHY